jgi:hypothetical protein
LGGEVYRGELDDDDDVFQLVDKTIKIARDVPYNGPTGLDKDLSLSA